MVPYFAGQMGHPLRGLSLWKNSTIHLDFVISIHRFINRLDPSLYKSHSFRIGAASWAAAKGFSNSKIRQLGRWISNAFLNYIQTPSLATSLSHN